MAKENSANSKALSADIDAGRVTQLQRRVDNNSKIIDDIVNKLVSDYCGYLDEYMAFIKKILDDTTNPPTDEELDDFVMNLSVLLYYTGEGQEALGVKEDVAKAIKMELYNETFDKASGTISDKTALAELATQNEYLTHVIYSRAYRKIKLRAEAGNEVLQSMKKIISRRVSAYGLSGVDPARIGGR